jgi:hypothetical protein
MRFSWGCDVAVNDAAQAVRGKENRLQPTFAPGIVRGRLVEPNRSAADGLPIGLHAPVWVALPGFPGSLPEGKTTSLLSPSSQPSSSLKINAKPFRFFRTPRRIAALPSSASTSTRKQEPARFAEKDFRHREHKDHKEAWESQWAYQASHHDQQHVETLCVLCAVCGE